ncbi:hypothetical protein [Myroides pelagicus]|uniref:Uncharacterized protein n=1 Tax=Myroides pelagicus TaxID=270914 RepID=A0A7K1GMR3_9FLAO|nr:hypothetical protein [Myroides pelagicus]MEC4114578.1 hypothetical protein [Myroides pelagicus]MTH30202.1 hypothetical protein [Myroides pelagicus]
MGWFTIKDRNWEIKSSWLILLGLFFPFVIPPIAMLHMGILGKIRSLLYGSFLWLALYIGVYSYYIIAGDDSIFKLLSFTVFLCAAVITAMYFRLYLQRLHLRSIINLRWDTSYDYKDFIRRKEISEILSISDFIVSLNKWKGLVKNNEIKGYIAKMIYITKEISNKNNQFVSELFLERHAFSIENILQQYYQIEISKLDNVVMNKAEEKLRFTLKQASTAFENELLEKVKYSKMQIEAESTAYLEDMKSRGLL